jgi:hypothetical protein
VTSAQTTPSPEQDTIAMLGLAAEFEFESFVRLAGDSASAPSIAERQVIARSATRALERQERLVARIEQLGGDAAEAMAPFDGIIDEFEQRTTAQAWSERLLKAYIGYAVADDFLRLLAEGADAESRELLTSMLGDPDYAELVVSQLSVVVGDEVAAARLALWGRRLVGDALAVIQGAVVRHPAFARLLERGSRVEGGEDRIQRVFAVLTAEHTRRMERLGLTA